MLPEVNAGIGDLALTIERRMRADVPVNRGLKRAQLLGGANLSKLALRAGDFQPLSTVAWDDCS